MLDATLATRIEVAAHIVDDLNAAWWQIDQAVAGAAKRGRTNSALSAMEGSPKARAGLGERAKAASALAGLKPERASVAAKGRQAETEAAPIHYAAELFGIRADSEKATRLLILMMVLTLCDPLAIALCAATSAKNN
jgi:hypothetical protein